MPAKSYGVQTGRAVTRAIPSPAGGVRLETIVPWKMVQRGCRREVITPLGAPLEFAKPVQAKRRTEDDSPLVRALGLAHHWQELLDSGRYQRLRDIAEAEGIDVGRVSRILRLTQLAPTIIEAAVSQGRLKVGVAELLTWFPEEWDVQRARLGE